MPIKEHPLPVKNHNQIGSHCTETSHLHKRDDSLSKFHKSTPYNIALKSHKFHQTFPMEKRMERN